MLAQQHPIISLILCLVLLQPAITHGQDVADDHATINQFEEKDENYALANILLQKARVEIDSGRVEKSLEYLDLALTASERAGYFEGIAESLFSRGMAYRADNKHINALENFILSLEHYQTLGNKHGEAKAFNLIGSIYRQQGNYPKALENLFASERIYSNVADTIGLSQVLNSIGIVYLAQKNYPKALEYYYQSFQIDQLEDDTIGQYISYLNVGEVYQRMGQSQKALEYYLRSIALARGIHENELEKSKDLGLLYNLIGGLYLDIGTLDLSQDYLKKALKIFKAKNDRNNLAKCHLNLGLLAIHLGNSAKALTSLNTALSLAEETESFDLLSEIHLSLSQVFENDNKLSKALHHYKEHINARDHLFNIDNTKRTIEAELLHKFEQQLNEASVKSAKKEAIAQETIRRQKSVRLYLGITIVLMIISLVVTQIAYRIKQKANKNLSRQRNEIFNKNKELLHQKEEILAQRDEIGHQNEQLKMSRQLIESKNERIISSIEYAQSIQQAILPADEQLSKIFPDSMVLFAPKDIVSGDFYWLSTVKDKQIVAVIDCTGHGVPGAFMSLIGNTMLNQIVNEWQTTNPAEILQLLHKQVRKTLQQDKKHSRTHASMDICLVSIDKQNKSCTFAGASRPLYVIQNGKLSKVAGNKRAAGGMQRTDEKERVFKNIDIPLMGTTYLYLASDGYSDQMNPKFKKFGVKRMINLLEEIHQEPMDRQRVILAKTLSDHQQDYEQIDDICVVGIRL